MRGDLGMASKVLLISIVLSSVLCARMVPEAASALEGTCRFDAIFYFLCEVGKVRNAFGVVWSAAVLCR